MDYLVECRCTHDLTRHDEGGCCGDGGRCSCKRTKLEALESAIDLARTSPWTQFLRLEPGTERDAEARTSA